MFIFEFDALISVLLANSPANSLISHLCQLQMSHMFNFECYALIGILPTDSPANPSVTHLRLLRMSLPRKNDAKCAM